MASEGSLPQHSALAHAQRDARRRAAREFMDQGLVVVPYTAPRGAGRRAGKVPLSDGAGGRAECRTLEEFEHYLGRVPTLNMAILGVAQVDADSPEAIARAAQLGVTSDARCWIIRTRRGWRAIYRPPGRELTNQVKAGDVDLDLLVNSPALVPPSIHPSGAPYRWAPGHSPADIPFADLEIPPPFLVEWWEFLCRPPARRGYTVGENNRGLVDTILGVVAARSGKGTLPSPGPSGWISTNCPFPEAHKHGDRERSFSIHVEHGGWICFAGCGSGSGRQLAERLGIPVCARRRTRLGVTVSRKLGVTGREGT